MLRVAIFGGPVAGKTTASLTFGVVVKHTDSLRKVPWSEQSEEISTWFNAPGSWVVEGVVVGRALRKWLRDNPEGRPVDMVIYLNEARAPLTPAQEHMRVGCQDVFNEIRPELEARGVHIKCAF